MQINIFIYLRLKYDAGYSTLDQFNLDNFL